MNLERYIGPVWWLIPVIPDTKEAEIEKITSEVKLGKKLAR
jgi:hypothetical protein